MQDKWSGSYWLHLEIRGNDTLKDLDYYLREIWLECCGHLSSFDFGEVLYTQIFDDGMGYKEEQQYQSGSRPCSRQTWKYPMSTTSAVRPSWSSK